MNIISTWVSISISDDGVNGKVMFMFCRRILKQIMNSIYLSVIISHLGYWIDSYLHNHYLYDDDGMTRLHTFNYIPP